MSSRNFIVSVLVALGLLTWISAFAGMTSEVGAQRRDSIAPQSNRSGDRQNDIEIDEATDSAEASESAEIAAPVPTIRPDFTQSTSETVEPLVRLLNEQKLGSPILNPLKYAIRNSVAAGVPVNTIVLLLLLPAVATLIAAARHLIGLRGFGIFLPAALAIVFLAIGPVVGIGLFLVIVSISTLVRVGFRRAKLKLQYLPRMALIMWFVVMGVLGVLFLAPVFPHPDFTNVSIFPVLILVLLSEEFSKVQIGKSGKTAINLTTETIILALVNFIFLTLRFIQEYALLNPEVLLIVVAIINYVMGKYVGLRLMEYWRYKKLIHG